MGLFVRYVPAGLSGGGGGGGGGTVTAVTGTSPISSSGGTTPDISIQTANGSQDGALSSTDWNTFNNKQPALGYTPENIANKNQPNGYAGLDGSGKISTSALPTSVMEFKGSWNASTNTPTLADGVGNLGDVYYVSVAGTQNLGSGSITFNVGDLVLYSGTIWEKAPAGGVTSVFGRLGAVTAQTGDYSVAQVTGAAPLASPAFTGSPTAPTASIGDSSTLLATTAFVQSQGFLTSTGAIPTGSQASSSVVTANSTTFVTAMTTTVTTTQASAPILAIATATLTTTTAASVARVRLTINGVASQVQDISLTALTTNYSISINQLSALLGPGTYTVNFDISRLSGTGTVNFTEGNLSAQGLQGTNSNGITQLTGALQAGPGSGSQVLSGVLPVANGGTHLSSTTINQILYSSANNVIAGLPTANTGALVTSSTGVPSITSGATANRLLRTNGTTVSFAQANLTSDVTGVLPGANGGTGTTMFAASRIPFSNGTTYAADALFIYTTANTRFFVGQGGGTGRVNGTVSLTDPTPNDLAGNFFSRTTANNCVNIQNENALVTLNMTNSGGTTLGANILAEASRGTLPARTQSQAGDILFSLATHGRTASAWSAGLAATIGVNTTEAVTDTTNGGEIFLSTTPAGGATPVEHLRIKQSGETTLVNSHLKSTQTTSTTIVATANAGTGASASLANATDVAGIINLTSGSGSFASGPQVTVTFGKAYTVAPIVLICAANANAAQDQASLHQIYVDAISTTGFSISFGIQPNTNGKVYQWNYHVIETQ